ncbi:polymorphic toxin type 28 domain-containing protein, partial [Streptomyces radiopugnans]|uniref:polymorphic toxin type 28 domain-containing protein n=1 Tax=Streptomyces radiopugnans TaxID=403935 RepID=UPI003F1C1243
VTVLPEESTSAIASRLNSSVYRFVYLLPTWCYFLWNLRSQSPGVHDQGEASLWTYTYTEGGEKTVSHLTFLPESERFAPYEVPVGEHHLWTKMKSAFKFFVFDPQDCADIASMDCAIGAISLLPAAKAAKLIKYGDEAADAASCGRKHSFLPGTDVLLADGTTKSIEDVEIGDKVVVTNPETGETTTREIVATIVTEDDKHFVDITITTEGGPASLVSTTTHPFWVESEEKWLDAGELAPGMSLRAPDGATVTVDKIRSFTKRQRTHDLTVQGIHTYYVLAGVTPVLVHNSNCGPLTKTDRIAEHLTFRDLDAAQRELAGEVVARKPDGTPWDHVAEVRDAQTGLLKRMHQIKVQMSKVGVEDPSFPALQAELSQASKLLDYSEKYVPRH